MGQINRQRGALAGAVLLALALTACSGPSNPAPTASQSASASAGAARTGPDPSSSLALPMAAATGKDTAEVEKARTELEKIKGQVPAELKEPFEKLKSIADDAGQDLSKFSSSEFDKAIAPIDGWLQAHC